MSESTTSVLSSQRETEMGVMQVRALASREVILIVTAAYASISGARGSIQLMRRGTKCVSRAFSWLLT